MNHEWMTKAEVAELLRVTPRTIENYVKRGELGAPTKIGGRVLWQRAVVHARLENSSVSSYSANLNPTCAVALP